MKLRYVGRVAAALAVVSVPRAQCQTVHPVGAPITSLNWRPNAATDSLRVDIDGDNVADVTFRHSSLPSGGQGQPSFETFSVRTPPGGAEVALDSVEYDSAHRFASGDLIRRGLRWGGTGYLAYTVTGNGGVGGRGFFRNGQSGYVAIRKNIAGRWSYWWFNITGKSAANSSIVSFYGQSVVVLAVAASRLIDKVPVFPNPTTNNWQLRGEGNYKLFDNTGRLVGQGGIQSAGLINGSHLAPGIYFLRFFSADGTISQCVLARE